MRFGVIGEEWVETGESGDRDSVELVAQGHGGMELKWWQTWAISLFVPAHGNNLYSASFVFVTSIQL